MRESLGQGIDRWKAPLSARNGPAYSPTGLKRDGRGIDRH